MKDCIGSLFALSDLPVKIVFRLCTRHKSVFDFYKKMELDMECDVMSDYWNEVRGIEYQNTLLMKLNVSILLFHL